MLTNIPLAISILSIIAIALLIAADWPDERRYKLGMIIMVLVTIALMFNQNR